MMTDHLPAGILLAPGQGKFLNPGLMAFNAFEIDIPRDLIAALQQPAILVRDCEDDGALVTLPGDLRLRNKRPKKWHSDICWLSNDDEDSYANFESIFTRLGLPRMVAPLIEHDREIRLYSGCFVTRSNCWALDMHYDWVTPECQAFTLMAPLTDNCADLGMTYETVRGERRVLQYRIGKGLVFGAGFRHSTAVGQLAERSVFLSLPFGSDHMDHWPALSRTVASQSDLLREPDGRFSRHKDRIARGLTAESY
jgi:hypothetical protein